MLDPVLWSTLLAIVVLVELFLDPVKELGKF